MNQPPDTNPLSSKYISQAGAAELTHESQTGLFVVPWHHKAARRAALWPY